MSARLLRALNLGILAGLFTLEYDQSSSFFPVIPLAVLCFIFLDDTTARGGAALMSFAVLIFLPRYLLSSRRLVEDFTARHFYLLHPGIASPSIPRLVFAQFLVAILFFVAVKLLWKWLASPLASLAVALPITLAGFFALPSIMAWSPFAGDFALVALAMLARGMIPVLFFRQVNAVAGFRDAIWAMPFWQLDIPNWDGRIPRSPFVPDQRAILRSLLCMFAGWLLIRGLGWILFSPEALGLANIAETGIWVLVSHQAPPWLGWVVLFYNVAQAIVIRFWIIMNSFVLFLNVIGIPSLPAFDRPWRAKSFADFLSRMFVYYSRTLMLLFYFPIYRRLRVLRRFRPLDQLLALFLSIFLFSILYHLSRDYWALYGERPLNGLLWNWSWCWLYSLLLSVAVCVSVAVERAPAWRDGYVPLRLALYVFVFACISFFVYYESSSVSAQWRAFGVLFGL